MKQRKRAEKLIKKGKRGRKLEREMRVDEWRRFMPVSERKRERERKKEESFQSRHYLFRIFLGQETVISFLFLLHFSFVRKSPLCLKKGGRESSRYTLQSNQRNSRFFVNDPSFDPRFVTRIPASGESCFVHPSIFSFLLLLILYYLSSSVQRAINQETISPPLFIFFPSFFHFMIIIVLLSLILFSQNAMH